MFASKTSTTLGILSLILLLLYTSNVNADKCSNVKAKSEVARISAEEACAKAAGIAINSADTTKAVAKKACDDAKIIAKNVADNAAFAACPPETVIQSPEKVPTTQSKPTEKASTVVAPKPETAACTNVKAKSEAARVSAEQACAKAAQVAIKSAEPTKAIAKKACDDAAIIAKNVANKGAAAAGCTPATTTHTQQNVSTTVLPKTISSVGSDKETAACTTVKAKSEAARDSAEQACAKAAQVAINSAEPSKVIAKKACDDAKIIAKNVADKAATAAGCSPATTSATTTQTQQNTTTSEPKKILSLIRKILVLLRLV